MAGEGNGLVITEEVMDELIHWLAIIQNELALLTRDLRESNEKMRAPSERREREIIFPIRPEEILDGRRD
jgi:hypothetical protein